MPNYDAQLWFAWMRSRAVPQFNILILLIIVFVSRRTNWAIYASLFAMYLPPANWQWLSWKLKTWKRWTSEGYPVCCSCVSLYLFCVFSGVIHDTDPLWSSQLILKTGQTFCIRSFMTSYWAVCFAYKQIKQLELILVDVVCIVYSTLRVLLWFLSYSYMLNYWMCVRSVREVVAGSQRKANSQEEDDDQEVYIKSVLQRIVQLRGSVRTDTGTAQ